jgi:hypothetical protein
MYTIARFLASCALVHLLAVPAWAIPIPDTQRVLVNGATWAQVNIFVRLTWGDINAQCPGGVCASGSVLGQWDMSGWTWAGPEDTAALFNYYLANAGVGGSDLIDPANLDDSYTTFENRRADWIAAVRHDFNYTSYDHLGGYYLNGWVAEYPGERYLMDFQYFGPESELFRNRAAASSAFSARPDVVGFGAWFFCTDDCPSSQSVAAPPVLPLVVLAIFGLALSRRKYAGLAPGGVI